MQQNMGQHLQSQQNIAGVPDNYAHTWSEVSEQFRISGGTVGGPQAPQGAHQVSPHSLQPYLVFSDSASSPSFPISYQYL
jgi:hypothetical protein